MINVVARLHRRVTGRRRAVLYHPGGMATLDHVVGKQLAPVQTDIDDIRRRIASTRRGRIGLAIADRIVR